MHQAVWAKTISEKRDNYLSFLYNLFMKKVFIIIESILYISFLILDLIKINTTYIKYAGIILCLIYALYNKKKYQTISFIFTAIADYFLLVILSHYEIGLLSFIIVQLVYFYFLGNINKAYFNMFLYIRGMVIIIGTLLLMIFNSMSLINELVLIYFSNLVFNTIEAWLIGKKTLAIGLSLFVCCDICVGLFNINSANSIALYLSWFFYLPSQVLIGLA